MLDSKENSFERDPTKALKQFEEYTKNYLDLKVSIDLRSNPEEIEMNSSVLAQAGTQQHTNPLKIKTFCHPV